jgi:signal transduction histidine kinase
MDAAGLTADSRSTLLELGQAVARATTCDDVVRVLVEVAGPLVRATNATALLLDESRAKLLVHHGPAARTQDVRVVDLSDPTPAAEVVRTGEPVYVATIEELCERYPRFVERLERVDWAALAVLPLIERGQLFGVVVYRWVEPVEFTPARRELLEAISELVAHALARARNYDHLVAHARRLRESNRDLDSFAAAVAHDLRQPLRQLSSYIDVLFDHLGPQHVDEESSHYAERIRASVQRADRLIVALLEYARAGGKPMADDEVDLSTIARDAVEALRVRLDEVGATVQVGGLPLVQVDPALFQQVLQNLIDNAAKYREPSRPVEIAISAEPSADPAVDHPGSPWWKVSVTDNGIGIPADQVAKIFDVFTRAQQGSKLSGTGIGLATAKRVVERHGGTIGVSSVAGEGSTFWFTVPGVAGRHRY